VRMAMLMEVEVWAASCFEVVPNTGATGGLQTDGPPRQAPIPGGVAALFLDQTSITPTRVALTRTVRQGGENRATILSITVGDSTFYVGFDEGTWVLSSSGIDTGGSDHNKEP